MYIRRALAAALVALILSGLPLVADESDAEYRGTINIANAGATVSGVTVQLTTNTQAFIDAGILDSSFNNAWFESAAGAALAFMPDPSDVSDWYFFYPYSLTGTATTLSYMYLGGPDMSAPIRYLPGAAGMSTADAASLELGNNFAIEQKGYLDTTYAADKRLVYKSAAFQTYVPSDGTIASVIGTPTTVRPTTFTDTGAVWFDDAKAYDNNAGTFAWVQTGLVPTGYLVMTRAATITNAVSLYLDIPTGDTSSGVDIDYYDGSNWHSLHSGALSGMGGWKVYPIGSYVSVEGVRIRRASGAVATLRVYEVEWTSVSAGVSAAVATGSHTIRTEADGTDMELYVDGVLEDSFTLGAVSVPNNANNWAACVNGAWSYLEYHKQWVGGVLRQSIAWENDTTFSDLSGNSNDATPSFPAASSDPDVTATLASMTPIAPAEAPGTSTDDGSGMAGGLPDEPDNLFDELDVDHLPGAAVVNALLDAGGIPRAIFWFLFVFFLIIVACILTYALSRSLMAMSLIAGAGMVFASKVGVVPYWVTVPLLIIAVAILIKEKMSPL
jgi:hypothetical protein